MSTTVTIENHGPHRINVNECEAFLRGADKLLGSHMLSVGDKMTVDVNGCRLFVTIAETDEGT